MNTSTDRIECEILLKAPRTKVWRALSNAEQFGNWFGIDFAGGHFTAGQSVQGRIIHPDYDHLTFAILIERVQPEYLLAWRWHPAPIDQSVDYSQEPTTLVVFELKDMDGGVLLTVVETGFDNIPLTRRAEAFRMNSNGWAQQMKNIESHLAMH
jgi:uncharacterized protein YndB with AHSA1/START domain